MEALYQTLKQRKRPEDVAEMIMELLTGELTRQEAETLGKAAKGSLKNHFMHYTSMAQAFAEPIGAHIQIAKTIELFKLNQTKTIESSNTTAVEAFIKQVSPVIHKNFGANDYMHDRLNKTQREAKGLDISKRQYNKLFRQLRFLEKKLAKMVRECQRLEYQQVAKHGLAHRLTYQEFSKDKFSACFIAYYTARCNLRSEFTIFGQQRPYDEIAEMLFRKATGQRAFLNQLLGKPLPHTTQANYLAMAYVYPDPTVLTHLDDTQKGNLLGQWTTLLQELAQLLACLWRENEINHETMIVKRGNDSSTWNAMAGAWNKSRDAWINLIYAMGLESILDELCFGKVLRLMAADVSAWHRMTGGKLDTNTEVWNSLPFPWEVFEGKQICTKAMVKLACKQADLNPEKSGWIAPRPHGIALYTPTPELVHGISITNPFLAAVLKKQGFYSGKALKAIQLPEN